MRGILECWIKQAYRVELFKQRQSNQHALHSKFHLHTGEEIFSDDLYNHLQIDVVSIYLIFLVQMITSGLQIIYTQVNWINLLYETAINWMKNLFENRRMKSHSFRISCTMWNELIEHRTSVCGNVDQNIMTGHRKFMPHLLVNTTSLFISRFESIDWLQLSGSIGMAKSALEAINGCNLFGEKGASWSVVYVDIDAHNRNRSIFETMLPRESSSKVCNSSHLKVYF